MHLTRSSGILLHPTSLPCTAGIGTIGKQAYRFVDWLCSAKQTLWQILPIGPTGYGDSPYASFSTFAGNPLLIDLELLVEKKYLQAKDILPPEWIKTSGYIDFASVVYWKNPLLKQAAKNFFAQMQKDKNLQKKYDDFVAEESYWLENYATFMSIKEFYDKKAQQEKVDGAMWSNYWPKELATRNTAAVKKWQNEHQEECNSHKAIQYFFFEQWMALKTYAKQKGISIVGDIPIFVAPDSADVWANQDLFQLDENGRATSVAGVPPDYFCETGQLWGNPLYNWDAMQKDGFAWWILRIKAMMKLVDFVRIDHFRGFEAYWSVPATEKTAVNGKWIAGPAHKLFNKIKDELGDIAIIAEDLGVITDGVKKLRDDFDLPGMKILQFAFDLNEEKNGALVNAFLPHMYPQNCVVYTGTHDNSTMQGWLKSASKQELRLVAKYLGVDCTSANAQNAQIDNLATCAQNVEEANLTPCKRIASGEICFSMVRLAFASTAAFAIVPLQDIYAVDDEGRMNTPATTGGHNWQWRMSEEHFDNAKALWLKELSMLYGRNLNAKE